MKKISQLIFFCCLASIGLAPSIALASSKHHHKSHKENCCSTPLSKSTTIKKSGIYCLAKDIKGTILIEADDVTLDLNSHEIDANSLPYAVSANGQTGVTIKNGTVVNSSVAGINIVACEEVEVSEITFRGHADLSLSIQATLVGPCLDGFQVTGPSQGILVKECDISEGNRAMLIRGCNDVRIEHSQAYNNVNTIANAVVGIEHCNDVLLQEVYVNNNTKAVPGEGAGPLNIVGPETAVLLVQACNNVQLKNCMTNGNFSENELSGLQVTGADFDLASFCFLFDLTSGVVIDGHQANGNTTTTGDLVGILVIFVANPEIRNSQTNGNITTNASNGDGFYGTQDLTAGLISGGSPGTFIQNHQANQNASHGSESYGIIATALSDALGNPILCDGTVLEDCMCNENGDPLTSTATSGVDLSVGFVLQPSNGAILRRCQTNENKAYANCSGMVLQWNDLLLENCQADNNTSTGAPDPANNVANGSTSGFKNFLCSTDISLISCEASGNTCVNNPAAGIHMFLDPPVNSSNPPYCPTGPLRVVVQECITNNNLSTHSTGYGVRLDGAIDSQVVDSTAIGNTVGFSNTAPDNSFFGNRADDNGTNYQIPGGNNNVVTFTKSTALFSSTPSRWSNISIVP